MRLRWIPRTFDKSVRAPLPWQEIIVVMVVAFSMRLWIPFAVHVNAKDLSDLVMSQPDCAGYVHIASNLVHGNGFSRASSPPYSPDLARTPVYPVFVALVFWISRFSFAALVLLQVAISCVSAGIVCALGMLIANDRRVGLVAGVLYAVDITGMAYVPLAMTETLFVFLFLCGAYWLATFFVTGREGFLWSASAMFGVATLCRPVTMYFPVVCVAGLVLIRQFRLRFVRHAFAAVVPFLLILTPWLVRNAVQFDVLVTSPNSPLSPRPGIHASRSNLR